MRRRTPGRSNPASGALGGFQPRFLGLCVVDALAAGSSAIRFNLSQWPATCTSRFISASCFAALLEWASCAGVGGILQRERRAIHDVTMGAT